MPRPETAFAPLLQVVDPLFGLDVRIGGGWGIDLLAGRCTRPHHDVDAFVPVASVDGAVARLTAVGYTVTGESAPWHTVLTAGDGRRVDLGGLAYRPGGDAVQVDDEGDMELFPSWCWTTLSVPGHPGGPDVTCLTVEGQRRKHRGYPARAVDAIDLSVLADLPPVSDRFDPAIRLVDPDEADLLALIDKAADRVLADHLPAPLPTGAPDADADLGAVTFVGGRPPVGFARMEVVDGAAHLAELAVLPEYAGEGLGTRLVAAGVDWARSQGYPAVTLTTFRDVPFNAPWYARLGFRALCGPLGPGLAAVWGEEADLRGVAPRVAMALDLDGAGAPRSGRGRQEV